MERSTNNAGKFWFFADETDVTENFRVVIGYDDLVVPLGEESLKPAVLQRGHSWMLTCTRSLNGEAVGNGTVTEAPRAPVTDEITIDTKFNLDIHCCDPEDTDVN